MGTDLNTKLTSVRALLSSLLVFRHRLFPQFSLRVQFGGYLAYKPNPELQFSGLCLSVATKVKRRYKLMP